MFLTIALIKINNIFKIFFKTFNYILMIFAMWAITGVRVLWLCKILNDVLEMQQKRLQFLINSTNN